jgi:hypothetical protein
MRALAGSIFAAGTFTAILVSAAQASSMHVEPDPFKPTQNFALRPGSAVRIRRVPSCLTHGISRSV